MKKVLIVEDEASIREIMTENLADSGFTVLEAKDGAEGLKLALAEHPDIILLDLHMPVMDGATMLEELRQDAWGEKVKVIVLSNQTDVDSIGGAYYDGGITEYIIKTNVSLEELKKKVRLAITIAS